MTAICRKVGNSIIVTIPNEITKKLGIRPGDKMHISENKGAIVLVPVKKKLRGEVFLEAYYNKSIDQIGEIETETVDWGAPQGDEIL